jgi:hypothetical protein
MVMASIAQAQWRERLQDRNLRFVIEGSNALLTPEEASRWIDESAKLGYTSVRYFVADDDGRTLVIQLAASSPPATAEDR